MRLENDAETRTIHPETLKEITLEIAIVMLGVAHDLRDGTIKPENYNQARHCGTACCIYGHAKMRLSKTERLELKRSWVEYDYEGLTDLFHGRHPSNPTLAAAAVEQYIYNHSKTPWRDTQTIG